MASSPPPSLDVSESYRQLHANALQSKPSVPADNEAYCVAIQPHNQESPTPESFLWFKVKSKHSVAKLQKAYAEKQDSVLGGRQFGFKFDGRTLSDTTKIRNLNALNDNTVVFTAHEMGDLRGSLTPSRAALARLPLQEVNTQVPAILEQPHITQEKPALQEEENVGARSVTFRPDPSQVNGYQQPIRVKPEFDLEEEENAGDRSVTRQDPVAAGPSQINGQEQSVRIKPEFSVESGAQEVKLEHEAFKHENDTKAQALDGFATSEAFELPELPQESQVQRIRRIVTDSSPEILEAEVAGSQRFLALLKQPLVTPTVPHKDAQHWVAQIDELLKHQINTPTIIGVVGNTGAGKSSVINAMLEEERLVPTNCMRACTAVVTELSWNSNNDPESKYRAEIEFIQPSDWEKDLKLSLDELLDSNGQISRECTSPDTEAGVAYAKIKAVYPRKTKEELASATVNELMREPGVKAVLGTTKSIAKKSSEMFYRVLQSYVDSKEKSTKDKEGKKEPRQMEYWPLIKVVRIYVKAEALSTGAVIVDLPGVHDSNAARAAVAAGYMKQCTGLFIVAPINRAVDDKAAKSLLGESFKRQLKFDGTYSRITFICSKTDDISIMEASDSLGLGDDMAEDWAKIDELDAEKRVIKNRMKELKESKAVYQELLNDSDDAIEKWEELKDQLESGEIVYAPVNKSKKRKRSSSSPKTSRKKTKPRHSASGDEDEGNAIDSDADVEESSPESDAESEHGDPLTVEDIDAKLSQFKEDKKRARSERSTIDGTVKVLRQELEVLETRLAEIDTKIAAVCIAGRNTYSKGAIQQDFADGIKELDQENAQEEDPDNFNPDEQLRDYEEVAKSLPVFCVSSRAYQKMQGRLQRDKDVPGFRTAEETEIPQLQAHCKQLTEAGRASSCRAYLTNLSQLLTSLGLWASNDGTGLNMTDAQLAAETRHLQKKLKDLEKGLEGAVRSALRDMTEVYEILDRLAEHIFEKYEDLVEKAVSEANTTVSNWHMPVNRNNRELGGFYWGTYRAIVRRQGVFSNAQGLHDLNLQLTEPIIKHLASHWERVFSQRLPRVLQGFSRNTKNLLSTFHRDIEARSMISGAGTAGIALLGHQLRNYEALFAALSQQMIDVINGLQREANREFTPVIARNLADAYDHCAGESGSGMFVRMKTHMASHIDSTKSEMFTESCDEVKDRLLAMCTSVEQTMANRADEVFIKMQRDYIEVVSGSALPQGVTMPRWERKMRSDVAELIEGRGKVSIDGDRMDLS